MQVYWELLRPFLGTETFSSPAISTQINRSCSFCGDPQKCRARDCKAYKYKCSKCNLFGHFDNYCCKGDDMASGSILNKLIQHIFTTNG